MFDDVITTGRTLKQAAVALRANGAREIYAGITHGVFCPDAFERVLQSPIQELAVSDTLDHSEMELPTNVVELSVAGLLGEAVQRIHEERSLSSLFV
jgi:ribose-phosphate pyrophosphokinase